ncbi:MAG: ion transporter [Deltaproteobacteria bacterium]|nr:ion transporter [Deltaproteobacteria bacterium]MBK8714761.1 ion transporter [Deltaproteobacteria bacterium]
MQTTRERLHEFLYQPQTRAARAFDLFVIALVLASMVMVVLESVPELQAAHGPVFERIEWVVTLAFTAEYLLRLYAAPVRLRYALSFFGIIDLVSTLPLYLALFVPGAASGVVLRGLRLLRLFRLFGHGRWADQGGLLVHAIKASVPKVVVFVSAVTIIAVILGTTMYLVEGPEGGFDTIPKGMYWAISTLTTVGYGDVVPTSIPGRMLASLVMVLGYGVIAVPVGIVSSDIAQTVEAYRKRLVCSSCEARGHAADSRFCRRCGAPLTVGEALTSSGSVPVVKLPPGEV